MNAHAFPEEHTRPADGRSEVRPSFRTDALTFEDCTNELQWKATPVAVMSRVDTMTPQTILLVGEGGTLIPAPWRRGTG